MQTIRRAQVGSFGWLWRRPHELCGPWILSLVVWYVGGCNRVEVNEPTTAAGDFCTVVDHGTRTTAQPVTLSSLTSSSSSPPPPEKKRCIDYLVSHSSKRVVRVAVYGRLKGKPENFDCVFNNDEDFRFICLSLSLILFINMLTSSSGMELSLGQPIWSV